MAKKRKEQPREIVDGPAIVMPSHALDRAFRGDDGRIAQTKGWRALTPLDTCHVKGQLAGGSHRYTEKERYEAGKRFADMFAFAQERGRDSTQALNVVSGSASGASISHAKSQVAKSLISVLSHLGTKDRRIITLVCGEGHTPATAVRDVCGQDYEKSVLPRFRESLDSLIEAFESERREPGIVNMARSA